MYECTLYYVVTQMPFSNSVSACLPFLFLASAFLALLVDKDILNLNLNLRHKHFATNKQKNGVQELDMVYCAHFQCVRKNLFFFKFSFRIGGYFRVI